MPALSQQQRPVSQEEEQNEGQTEAEVQSESASLETDGGGEQEDGFFTKVKNFFTGKGKSKDKTKDTEKGKTKEPEPVQDSPPEPEKTPAEVLEELLKAGSGELKGLWEKASAGQREAVATLAKTKDVGDDVLKTLFDATPNAELKVLTILFEKRYDVSVGQTLSGDKTGKAWDTEGVRRCWTILETLPDDHVRGNAWLEHWTRYDGGSGAGGFYSGGRKESSVTYDKDEIDKANTSAHKGDPLYGVVRFDKVVRHEVGHAVDKKIGAEAALCLGNATGGNWEKHGAPTADLVDKMIAAGGVKIKALKDEHKSAVAGAILKAMQDGKPGDTAKNIKALDIFKAPDEKTPAALDQATLDDVLKDPVAVTSEKCGKDKSPWYKLGDMGIDVGGRHYQVDYGKTWVSYDKAALAKKVSTYQFRAPGEWFAEAYATYFQPDGEGKVGKLLEGRDPTTKEWFDKNVLPQEKKEAPKEAEGKEPKKDEPLTDKGGGKGG